MESIRIKTINAIAQEGLDLFTDRYAVDPKEGLKDFMSSYGLNKSQRKLGQKMLADALSEIGSI